MARCADEIAWISLLASSDRRGCSTGAQGSDCVADAPSSPDDLQDPPPAPGLWHSGEKEVQPLPSYAVVEGRSTVERSLRPAPATLGRCWAYDPAGGIGRRRHRRFRPWFFT